MTPSSVRDGRATALKRRKERSAPAVRASEAASLSQWISLALDEVDASYPWGSLIQEPLHL